jgi:hypothetical protein
MICFDPVVTNCLGGPEIISFYFIPFVLIDLTHWIACPMPENPDQMCPVYEYSEQAFQSNGADPCVPWPDPDLYDVFVFYHHPGYATLPSVIAVDAAGNTCEDPCP